MVGSQNDIKEDNITATNDEMNANEAKPSAEKPPHKLSSIISSLLTQRQGGQVNSNPSLTTAAALWARHSQHLKNSTEDASTSSTTKEEANADHDMENHNEAGKNNLSALKQMEQMMGRNYSDFMRTLASKYKQSPTNKDMTNGEAFKPNLPNPSPFFLPGNPFQLAAAAVAASTGLPVNSPFFRPPQPAASNVMEQMSQTQQALLNMMRTASAAAQQKDLKRAKKDEPVDLSPSPSPSKKQRKSCEESVSTCNLVSPCSHEAKEVKNWSVDEVCQFVASVDLCQPFAEKFREQGIDGGTLILLKEDHLVTTMKMRLGAILKFKAALASKIGSCPICLHCVHCHHENNGETKTESDPE